MDELDWPDETEGFWMTNAEAYDLLENKLNIAVEALSRISNDGGDNSHIANKALSDIKALDVHPVSPK